MHLPGEEASLVLIQFISNESVKKGGERLIGWVCLPVESCGEHHLQLRSPPLPKSAAEARRRVVRMRLYRMPGVHCELNVAVTGSMARYIALREEGGGKEGRVQAASRKARGLNRMQSVLFDPLSTSSTSTTLNEDYILPPEHLLATVVNVPTAVAISTVSAVASTVTSAVGVLARAASNLTGVGADPLPR